MTWCTFKKKKKKRRIHSQYFQTTNFGHCFSSFVFFLFKFARSCIFTIYSRDKINVMLNSFQSNELGKLFMIQPKIWKKRIESTELFKWPDADTYSMNEYWIYPNSKWNELKRNKHTSTNSRCNCSYILVFALSLRLFYINKCHYNFVALQIEMIRILDSDHSLKMFTIKTKC